VSVCAGAKLTCALGDHGGVWCWGDNELGSLGVPSKTTPSSASPLSISGLPANTTTLSCVAGLVCVGTADHRVECWGDNTLGGAAPGVHDSEVDTPTPVAGIDDALQVVAGDSSACVLRSSNEVWCWGDNQDGELGIGSSTGSSATDQPPQAAVGVAGAVQVAAGGNAACTVVSGGQVMCFGVDGHGELGDQGAAAPSQATPTGILGLQGVTQISLGIFMGCGLAQGGGVLCWGDNYVGQLGRGTMGEMSLAPAPVVRLPPVLSVAASGGVACAVATDGGLWCWGGNSYGQLGSADTTTKSPIPTQVPGLTGVQQVAVGFDHACALTIDHSVWCWGTNDKGQVGNGSTGGVVPPTRVTVPLL
jgi:alpha-tubulin suppressor-like RCC1 family protein